MVPCKGNRPDPLLPEFFMQALNKGQNPLLHFANVTLVGKFADNLLLIVDDDTIQADRSGINTHIV